MTRELVVRAIEELYLVPNDKFVDACFNVSRAKMRASQRTPPSLQLYYLSRHRQAFILLGRTLAGKTLALKVVKRLLRLSASINCRVFKLNPSQLDTNALYGHYERARRIDWIAGLLPQKLTTKYADDEEGWIVLDGVLDSVWTENMNSLFDSHKKVRLRVKLGQRRHSSFTNILCSACARAHELG